MTPSGSIRLAAMVAMTLATPAAFAQGGTTPGMTEKPAAMPQSIGSGTGPDGKGSTGWTGGSRTQKDHPDAANDTEAAKNQPLMATGQDLKGPPQRFPAAKTPE